MPEGSLTLKRSGIPLYVQVAGLLRRELAAGTWRLGEQIPIIDSLMERYNVSRITMRQALGELESEGLVKRGQGRGTFVTRDTTQDRWLILPTEWNALISHIAHLDSRFVEVACGEATPPAMYGSEGLAKAYWHTKRVNYLSDAPYSLTNVYLELATYKKNARRYDNGAILPALAKAIGKSLGTATQTLTVSTADVETASHLQVTVGTPVVEVLRRVWNSHRRIVYLAEIRYSARHLRIETTLFPPRDNNPSNEAT